MSDTYQKIRLISQLQSTLANHADVMSLLPPNDSMVSKMREIDSMLQEQIALLEHEVAEAESSTSDGGVPTESAQAPHTLDAVPRTPVPATEGDDLAGPHGRDLPDRPITSEEMERFRQRPPPLEIVDVQRPMVVYNVRRNGRREPFRSSALNRLVPTPTNTPFLHKPMK
ncbi:hypothetical protein FOCG_11215 [Fusarium oxysporum f. sp. radicis-lycopersici 26381]|uniref:Uncharacterized protein n=4 Tax=Fusarium oxysporum TaxID=5507 RepID=A0A2H3HV35_FUSOX|nr:uncharacterized protein FOBCDRAFT_196596 [Fusarium oxysporum Fo47]EXL46897.1 hypothetical protein FOCG_11215 [Fusarium oxysporum f. sp. radicis-lycopersici 26381]KAF5264463.1 hypothetical protein FOXYS1_4749 [Fusarium oxysporum]PCD42403.1 hypothetical protein AU210_004931 [Fusarium oxysporum f. sp. radicis-cucumerinum]RYC95231.1 hypothetical protein BFJ63_vAg1915 [Fusarium oxysporum f. sp. narcissi]EWZ47004.1 hypothetical protein FOZG_02990 [Fusarium oxysporum Fo47]